MIKGKKKASINISLTDFVDFVCKAGSSKLTKVKQLKNRGEYSPATDFYRILRDGIIEIHQKRWDPKELKNILVALTDAKKKANYSTAIDGYKRFWGKKTLIYFTPPSQQWNVGDVNVRINPELGLRIGGKSYVVKLYFKSDKISKDKIDQILTLMEDRLRKDVDSGVQMAILDVKNAKLYSKKDDDLSLLPLLDGEVISFETIWKSV